MGSLASLGYIGMFLSAFLAATILPLSSEVMLAALFTSGFSPLLLLVVASTGNILGSFVNYVLGHRYGRVVATKWLRVDDSTFARASHLFERWGKWSLLLAWVPVIGDPITLVAGVLRTNVWFFLCCVIVSKTSRYAVLLFVLS